MGVKDTANLAMIPAAYAEDKVYSVLPSDGDGDFTFTRTGSGTRINKGGYIETMGNNVPRLNYRLDADGNPTECAELLLEESRINYISRSEEFNLWGDSGVIVTTNATIAPNGTQTADKLVSTANNWRKSQSFSGSSGTTYSVSVFVKLDTTTSTTTAQIEIFKGASGLVCDFNLYNETIPENTGLNNPFIEKYPNDWFRIGGTYTANGTTQIMYVYPSANYGIGGTMFFWGAQVEAGSTVSSYIPTGASQVTRNKDEAEINNFADAPTDYPFTMYVQMRIETGIKGFGMSFGWDATSDRYYSIGYSEASSNKKFRFTNRSQGTGYDFEPSAEYYEGLHKVAVKFISSTNFKGYINGIEVANHTHTASSFNSSIQDLLLGQLREVGDTNSRNPIKEAFMWNKALTDAEMVEITTP